MTWLLSLVHAVLGAVAGLLGMVGIALRETGVGDFTTELRAILVAARTKQDISGARSDIVLVASYYLQQWAGAKPAPDDPPPK